MKNFEPISYVVFVSLLLFSLLTGCALTGTAAVSSVDSTDVHRAKERDRAIGAKDGRSAEEVIASIDSSGWKVDPAAYGMTAMEYQQATASVMFQKQISRAGGVNKWNHFPGITKAADHWVVSTNNDVMFSIAIVDARQGFTVTLPDVGERFISLHVQDEYHTIVEYSWSSGKHVFSADEIDTDYVLVIIRVATTGTDEDLRYIREQVQSKCRITANSAVPFKADFDLAIMQTIRQKMMVEYEAMGDNNGTVKYDIRAVDNWEKWAYSITGGFGLSPEDAAMYPVFAPKGTKANVCYEASFDRVPAREFFSLTLYDFDKFLMSDDYNIISSNRPDFIARQDGGFDVVFGGMNCKKIADQRGVNFGYTPTDGWNGVIRSYRPEVEKMYRYKMPELKKIEL